MLVLSRKIGQEILIGDNITVVVNKLSGNRVSLGISAPRDVSVVRGEIPRGQRRPEEVPGRDVAESAVGLKQAVGLVLDIEFDGYAATPTQPR